MVRFLIRSIPGTDYKFVVAEFNCLFKKLPITEAYMLIGMVLSAK